MNGHASRLQPPWVVPSDQQAPTWGPWPLKPPRGTFNGHARLPCALLHKCASPFHFPTDLSACILMRRTGVSADHLCALREWCSSQVRPVFRVQDAGSQGRGFIYPGSVTQAVVERSFSFPTKHYNPSTLWLKCNLLMIIRLKSFPLHK